MIWGASVLGGMMLTLISAYAWLGINTNREVSDMMKVVLPTGEVESDIFTILDGHANVYLIKGKDGYIAIDGGEKPENMLEGLKELGIQPEEVKYVLLTHSDMDHAGGVEVFTQAHVLLSKEEAAIVEGRAPRRFSRFRLPVPNSNKIAHSYETVNDGRILNIQGHKVECVLTPGHTCGSMCFILDDEIIFTGDTTKLDKGKMMPFVPLFTMDKPENSRSVEQVKQLVSDRNIRTVMSAHHGVTNI